MVYKYAPGSRIKTDPNITGRMCEELERSEAGLTAQTLLDANRPKSAPLHNEFEWDNKKAAEAYRLDQARYILRSLIIVPDEEKPKETVRAVFTVQDSKYESIDVILKNDEKRSALFTIALRELKAIERKYSTISELAPVWFALDTVERSNNA